MTRRGDSLDVRQLGDQGLPRAAFPAAHMDYRVYFDVETHERIVRHAGEDMSVEICGVLVGRWEQDDDGPFVVIADSIRCDDAAKKSGEVTFTHESWNSINREMDTRFIDLKIVGWYHSHPSFGVFLSERDVFIHEHFFSSPGQVAFVVDPVQETEGVFTWRNGKPKPCEHYWVGDRICVSTTEQSAGSARRQDRPENANPTEGRPVEQESLSSMLLRFALPLCAALLFGYLLASMKTSWEQQRIIEGTVAHFRDWKCLRLGLRENLALVAQEVRLVQGAVDDLSAQHIKLSGQDASDVQAKWREVSHELYRTQHNLKIIGAAYGLNQAEMAACKVLLLDKKMDFDGEAMEKGKTKVNEKEKTKKKPGPTSSQNTKPPRNPPGR